MSLLQYFIFFYSIHKREFLLLRKWHRDIAYYFLGMILSFAISGIALNHRTTFNSRSYIYQSEPLQITLDKNATDIDDDYVRTLLPMVGIENEYRSFRMRDNELRIYYKDAQANIDINSGRGEREFLKKRILLAEIADLHQTTNEWWIWYSDIFGVAMVCLALSGACIASGKNSFKKRGWWLTLIGFTFPLIFLIFLI